MNKFINFDLLKEYLLYMFIFLLPWQTRYIFRFLELGVENYEYGKLSIYLSEIVLLILFLLFVASWMFKGISKNKMRNSFVFSFLFLVIASLGYIIANDKQMFSYSVLRLSEAIFLLFVLSKMKFSFFKLAISFVASMLIHASLGIYQFFSQSILANKYFGISEQIASNYGPSVIKMESERILRAYGGMSHPNILGGFIVIAILFLLIIFINNYSKFSNLIKIFFWTSLFILSTCFILTFSRSAYLALFIALSILLLRFIYKKQFNVIKLFILTLFLFLAINFFIFHNLIIARMPSSDIRSDTSEIERVELNKQAINVIRANLFFGVGLGNYIPYVFSNDVGKLKVWQYQPVHNIFLLLLSETGIVGLIMFLLILVLSFIEKLKSKSHLDFIMLCSLLSIIVIGLFDHYFITSFSGLVLFFLLLDTHF